MDNTRNERRGLDPNSATGTRDAIDPETGTVGTGGTPLTTGYGMSGSTIGTGSASGEAQHERGDLDGATPDTKGYMAGQRQATEPIPAPKPNQAEGDRETVEQDHREKEADGTI